jgi:lipopolysaccharide transport system permease protein
MSNRYESSGWLAELVRYRELFWFLAWRDVKIRYKQTALGAAWAILQPLSVMIVFTLFIGRMTGLATDNSPYPVFVYSALLPWTYFSTSLVMASNSLIANSSLITKVYFPRLLLPAASALSGLLDLLIGSVFLVVLMLYYGIEPTWRLVFFPGLIIGLWILTVGVGMGLAALNANYRDVKYTVPLILQLGLFVTPILYPSRLVPANLRPLLAANPLTGFIEAFRACVMPNAPFDPQSLVWSAITTSIICVAGIVYFRKTERVLADVV